MSCDDRASPARPPSPTARLGLLGSLAHLFTLGAGARHHRHPEDCGRPLQEGLARRPRCAHVWLAASCTRGLQLLRAATAVSCAASALLISSTAARLLRAGCSSACICRPCTCRRCPEHHPLVHRRCQGCGRGAAPPQRCAAAALLDEWDAWQSSSAYKGGGCTGPAVDVCCPARQASLLLLLTPAALPVLPRRLQAS